MVVCFVVLLVVGGCVFFESDVDVVVVDEVVVESRLNYIGCFGFVDLVGRSEYFGYFS